MKRIVGLVLASFFLLSLTVAGQPPADIKPAFQTLSYELALGTARREKDKIVMIDFGATWCGPCKQLEATTFKDSQVKEFLSGNLIAIKVDIDQHPALAKKHGVNAVPTMLFLDGEGKEIERLVGYKSAEQFMQAVRRVQKK